MTQEEVNKLQIGDVIFDMNKKEAYHLMKIEDGCVYYEGAPHWGSIPKTNLLEWNMVSLMRDRVVYCKDTVLEWVRLAYGKLSMNPLDVQDVFEELIDKIKQL